MRKTSETAPAISRASTSEPADGGQAGQAPATGRVTAGAERYEPTLDEELAQLFCGGVDLAKVQGAVKVMHNALIAHDEAMTVQTVAYSAAALLANALLTRGELSEAFRVKILGGFGDVAGSMLRAGLASQRAALAGHVANETVGIREKPAVAPRAPAETHPLDDIFTTLTDPDDDIYSLEQFQSMVDDGAVTDEDGGGRLAIKDEPDSYYYAPDAKVIPSKFKGMSKEGATHVVWYNK